MAAIAQSVKNYFVESYRELGKVTWPTRSRALNICILVVSFVLISAFVIAGIDFVFNQGYNYLRAFGESVAGGASPLVDVTPL